ncbi:FG-GAP repeat-containing protein [Nitzschia inconspicua]|uniref:FG-GAP repeat-containing protein n=1 Tax=Nitzschia inconspicua TaxID=303405 RepID=A0A9K3M298_9STRA|nr:FG-GAP repeat-containing protein [Nitzschia inconspicua]
MKKDPIVCSSYYRNSFGSVDNGVTSWAEFGWSVAVNCDGSQVLVGSANDPSAVYMFNHRGEILRTFHNPLGSHATKHDDELKSQFGFVVKMNVNGQRILIGDPAFGVVYLYDDRGHLIHTFVSPNSEVETKFGGALAISDDGSRIAIGARHDEMDIPYEAVYLFYESIVQSSGHTKPWIMADPITSPHQGPDDHGGFGVSVALTPDGTKLLIGAWKERQLQGAAYLYNIVSVLGKHAHDSIPARDLVLAAEYFCGFASPNPAIAKGFGWAVDLTDQYAIIGARMEMQNHEPDAGAVYIFSMQKEDEATGAACNAAMDTIMQPLPVANKQFGAAVSIAGNRLLVASYSDGTAFWYESTITYVAAAQSNKTHFILRERIPVPTLLPTAPSTHGAAVALSRNGRVGVVGVPRALGRGGHVATGAALGLCLPDPGTGTTTLDFTCPELDLYAVSWKDLRAFWFSWDSDSGKALALIGTVILCLCILFCRFKRRQHRQRYLFQRLPTEPAQEHEMELQVIQEFLVIS